ncbi:phosphate ABC transporter permease PstA [Alkalibaculum sp. M08DMB]|uniref:Phosphate transport system permease protein PstA n=1 Tax=Alkalibaculum sporogenes TaxID=2655001 RepID=A0A6A7K9Z8_9FIRM|nr:phosphate ABC transporter permease PstA [Alkalibaculum sporogenes]
MRKAKDYLAKILIYLSSFITVGVLLAIIAYIFINGIGLINWSFFTNEYNDKTYYLQFEANKLQLSDNSYKDNIPYTRNVINNDSEPLYIEELGGAIIESKKGSDIEFIISYVEKSSSMLEAKDRRGEIVGIKEGYIIRSINGENIEDKNLEEISNIVGDIQGNIELKVTNPGNGVFTNIITTLYMILLSLSIATPIGILAAIYLVEYARPGKLVSTIRFATESLAGIPSIIYGLFGMAFFVVFLKFSLSLLAGALTISIILLPVIIRSTEEALKAVPDSYREASYGLGATKLQTISKIIIPSAMPGILVAVILSIGRIIGESAALLLTAGTVSKIPENLFSSGGTLTVQAYYVAKEEANIEMACAIGIVVILLIIILNLIAKLISKIFNKANY